MKSAFYKSETIVQTRKRYTYLKTLPSKSQNIGTTVPLPFDCKPLVQNLQKKDIIKSKIQLERIYFTLYTYTFMEVTAQNFLCPSSFILAAVQQHWQLLHSCCSWYMIHCNRTSANGRSFVTLQMHALKIDILPELFRLSSIIQRSLRVR